ncbi:MAG: sugar transferase [Phycisphaerae bacterium]|nr:sugar transferase [Phycisphaerae bacterium]NUQ47662.1 sugar transferase [Phycisphaerae bacterium]
MSTQPVPITRTFAGLSWAAARWSDFRGAARRGGRAVIGRFLLNISPTAWMGLDLLIVCIGTLIGQRVFVWWHADVSVLADYRLWLTSTALGCAVVLAGQMFGLYEHKALWSSLRIVARSLLTILFAMLATAVILRVFLYSDISRRTAAFTIVFYLVCATGVRLLAHRAVLRVRRGLLLVGHGSGTSMLLRAIQHGRLEGYRLCGIVSDDPRRHGHTIRGVPVLGGVEHLERMLARHDIEEVVVADRGERSACYERAAMICLRHGCRLTNEATFYETAFGEVPVAHISPKWFFSADLRGQREEHAALKRVCDVAVSLTGLLITLPLWPAMILLIRMQDGGPAFYAQRRVGLRGTTFRLIKFRTMTLNAERGGCVWAADNDPRVTRIGRWLRRTRLDELPQLWNVLRGDMSMVGPRPERPDIVEPLSRLIPHYQERHLVKPGVTGWAQIRYRYGASVADARRKLQFDLYYIKHMSLELDLLILLRTVGTFLLGAR